MSKVTLVHPFLKPPQAIIHFYDGFVVAENGVVTIDGDDERNLESVWRHGYNTTLDGRRLWEFPQVLKERDMTALSANKSVEATTSASNSRASMLKEDDVEGNATGR